jgi:hypothetical protein
MSWQTDCALGQLRREGMVSTTVYVHALFVTRGAAVPSSQAEPWNPGRQKHSKPAALLARTQRRLPATATE